jgi:Protein of unknown function (DUF3019)
LAASARLAGALGILLALGWMHTTAGASDVSSNAIRLEISPRLCTLAASDTQCDVAVRASWSAPQDESLCLVLVGRPEIKRCWEDYASGTYTVQLEFSQDLTFQLRDPSLQNILASEVLRVLREALQYRHWRRQPWNVFD